jgi:hypothetical protein
MRSSCSQEIDQLAGARAAAAAQDRSPQHVLDAGDLRTGLRAAAASDPGWIWLLDEAVQPAPGALRELLRVGEDPSGLTPPLVLVGKVLDAAGALHADSLPIHEYRKLEVAVAACRDRIVAIRAARSGSVLVRGDAVARFGLPRRGLAPAGALLEWSARMLRDPGSAGYLVPGSVARRAGPVAPASAEHRHRLAVLAGPAWSPLEWRREAYGLAADVTAGLLRARRA